MIFEFLISLFKFNFSISSILLVISPIKFTIIPEESHISISESKFMLEKLQEKKSQSLLL